LDPFIDPANGRKGKWTAGEDSKLKDAVRTHGGKNWIAIAALVPGRTKIQCSKRWHDALIPSIALTAGRTGEWSEDEDSKLKDAVQTPGGMSWGAIAALIPGRTKIQCGNRWYNGLNPFIDQVNGRTGKWSEDEDIKLKDAVQTPGG
jgi:myb proto-oncogene protein